ncbi:MAG: DUF1634 domain-containing protein [Acidobacteriota bacterium]|nr:DUF1634 domain-containing protein [Acidobacteriota bacterium]
MRTADEKLQLLICWTLRAGVLGATALGLVGGALFYSAHLMSAHPAHALFGVFQGASMPFSEPGEILRQAFGARGEALELRGLSIIQVGIMLLLATPVIRVVFSVVGFLLEKDYFYVWITLAVLVVLTASICLH